MKYEWFSDYCTSKKSAFTDYKLEWKAHRYTILDKMFGMRANDNHGKEIITLKLAPEFGGFLRIQYQGIIVPGYYMNKEHWNSVYLEPGIPDDVLKDMADKSYDLILAGFSKKKQKEILEAEQF